MAPLFRNRAEAGQLLAERLSGYARRSDTIVLALPRGGVPVAHEIAEALNLPLDVFVVRKLGVPGHEELAMGAIASGGVCLLNFRLIERLGITRDQIEAVADAEFSELDRRTAAYRDARPLPAIAGCTVILVDDGLATGASMLTAVTALRKFRPAWIVAAVPVAAPEACAVLQRHADEVVCVKATGAFESVGACYGDY